MSEALDSHQKSDAALTATVSLAAFGLAVAFCACALLLSEETKAARDGSKA